MTRGPLAAALLLAASSAAAAEKLPEWARAAEGAAVASPGGAPAVVLLRERQVVFDREGRTETRERMLVRCLTADCADHASVAVPYLRGTQKVTGLRLQLRNPDGSGRTLGAKEVVDAATDLESLYDESRVAILSARREVVPGTLLASEWTRRDAHPFPQLLVPLQERLPVAAARLTVALPGGWRADAVTLDHPPIAASGSSPLAWEARDLPYRPEEPLAPPLASVAPRLLVTVRPAAGEGGAFPPFASWQEVSRWAATLFEPAAAPDDAVAARSRELAAGAASPRAKVEAAARFVQEITYVSIGLDLGRGGGYRPRAAGEVLRQGYGDCKDKVTLLRGLLRAAGLATRPVLVCARDATAVRRETPMPFAFDHVIVGIAGVEAKPGEPVVEVGGERLLLFDPTDPFTPLGQVPEGLFRGLGLVVTPEGSGLVTVPAGEARLVRRLTGELKGDGTFRAHVVESGAGATAESLRALARRASADELRTAVEGWLSSKVPGVAVSAIAATEVDGGPALEADLAGRLPGVPAAGKFMVIRPVLIPWRGFPSLPPGERRLPLVLRPRVFSSEYRLRLPPSFDVSELPPPVKLARPFGSYEMAVKAEEGTLVARQELRLEGAVVAPADYAAAREFVNAVVASRDAAVVLKRSW